MAIQLLLVQHFLLGPAQCLQGWLTITLATTRATKRATAHAQQAANDAALRYGLTDAFCQWFAVTDIAPHLFAAGLRNFLSALPDGSLHTAREYVAGRVTHAPRGNDGLDILEAQLDTQVIDPAAQ